MKTSRPHLPTVFGAAAAALGLFILPLAASASIPQAEREALLALYAVTGGPGWADSTNWGGAPGTENTWTGVLTDPDNTTVLALDLGGNNLEGELPDELGDLTNLHALDLSGNRLYGAVPAGLARLGRLSDVDFSGNARLVVLPEAQPRAEGGGEWTEVAASAAAASPEEQPAITGLAFKLTVHDGVVLVCKLTVTGRDFQPGCVVKINGQPAPKNLYQSETQVLAKGGAKLKKMLPKGQTHQITVTNPDGQTSNPSPFVRP
jgi:hypothetical protein